MRDIIVRGKVTIRQGDKILVKEALNHFVDGGLSGLISTIIAANHQGSGGVAPATYPLWSNNDGWKMYLGSDTATATTTGMTALTTPIGTTPGTAPSVQSLSSKDGTADGIWRAIYHATWDAGAVSGTLGELALYCYPPDHKTVFAWVDSGLGIDREMVSRLSSADTDFSSFAINTAVPLTVDWTVELAFA